MIAGKTRAVDDIRHNKATESLGTKTQLKLILQSNNINDEASMVSQHMVLSQSS